MSIDNKISTIKAVGVAAMAVGASAFGAGEFKAYDSKEQMNQANDKIALVETYRSQIKLGEYASRIGEISFAVGFSAYAFSSCMRRLRPSERK